MCNGTITSLNGSVIDNDSIPEGKIKWQTGTTFPGIKSWPLSVAMFEKYMDDWDGAPGTGGNASNQAIIFDQFGGPGKTGAENRQGLINAMAEAQNKGISIVQYGYGTYVQDPFDLIGYENITIQGFGVSGTKIQMSNAHPEDIDGGSVGGQGDAVFKLRACNNITIRRMTIDCEDSYTAGAGGIWVSGNNNIVEDVLVKNGDGFSICVIGSYSNGSIFVPTTTKDNIVRNCVITGQRRYHSIGAKAALLVAESATRTICENILLVDNFLSGGETGDYAGNDHGLYTTFRNLVCIKTTAGLADGAALHLEGGESLTDMYVTVENFTAINFTVGTSVSEKSKATYFGQNRIVGCKYAIKSYGEYTSTFTNFEIIGCGAGLESSDTEGIVNNSTSGIYQNLKFTGSLARCEFVNYNGSSDNSVALQTRVENSHFTKYVRLSYTNVGSYFMALDGCVFTSTRVDWYNNTGLRVDITNCFFKDSTINGARVQRAIVGGNTRFYTTNSALVAIDLTTDNFNTYVENSTFEGYASIGANATMGFGIRYNSITSPPAGATISTNLVVDNAAGTTSSISLEDGAFSKTVGAGFFFNSGVVAPPSLIGPGVTSTDGPNAKAALEVRSNVKGLLVPRMTTSDKTTFGGTLGSGESGMIVFDVNTNKLCVWDGTAWQNCW